MKPLRNGLAAGLLAGGVGAATKLIEDWRAGGSGSGSGSGRVVTGSNGKGPAKGGLGGVTAAVGSAMAKRAARRAEANRPPWVVAAAPGAITTSASPTSPAAPPRPAPRPVPVVARKLPSLDQLKPPTVKSVGATVGKYAAKQAGKAIGKVAAERVGKAIEVIETLEKVVATATKPEAKPDMTPSGPGAAVVVAPVEGMAPAAGAVTVAADRPKPQGTLVSVRKRERGPRVVVGPGVAQPPAAVEENPVAAAIETVAEAVEEAITQAAAAPTEAEAVTTEADAAPTEAKPAPEPARPKTPRKKAAPKMKSEPPTGS